MTVLLCLPLPNNVQIKIPPKLNWDQSNHSWILWYEQSWYISCPVFIALFSPLLLLFNPNKVCKLSYHAFSGVFSLHLALLLFMCSAGRLLFWQIFHEFLQVRISEEVDQVIKGLDLACSPTDPCRTRMCIGVGSACLQLSFLSRETSSCLVKFTLHFLFVSRAIHSTPG